MIDLDKTVFSGGRASLLRPLPSFRNGAARTGRRDFLGLVGLYTGAKVRLFRRTGKKSAFYSLRSSEKQLFRHLSLVFPSLFQAPHPIHIAVTHHIIEASTPRRRGKVLSPPPEGAAEAASGGARASSGGTSPRSPPDEGETPRDLPKATGGSPVRDAAARRVGGSGARESPQSSTRRRSGGGKRWSTCIKRWNVATLSPRRRGDTARPTQGDRRKPRERRRSPKRRQVGGVGKSSVLHPKAQRRRQAVEHVHQAVEGDDAVGKAEDTGGTTDEEAARRVGGTVAGVDENAGTAGNALQTRQSRPPGHRPSAGRAGKAWRNHVEAQGIFARGNGRMRPRSGRFERGHGRLSALGGKKQHPLRAPGQVGGAAQTNQCRHLEKIDVVNEIRAPLAAPVTNIEGMPPEAPAAQSQLSRHGGSAKALSAHPAAPVGNSKGIPPEALAELPQTARHGGSAKALSGHPAAPVENYKGMPPETPAAQPQTARHGGSAKALSAYPAAPVGNCKGMLPEDPAAQPQTARHGGSVEGSREAHADGETRHGASSRRLHQAISPWRGAGSRGATVGWPSAHCASPGRHSEPRPRQPHRPSACAASPSSKAPTA